MNSGRDPGDLRKPATVARGSSTLADALVSRRGGLLDRGAMAAFAVPTRSGAPSTKDREPLPRPSPGGPERCGSGHLGWVGEPITAGGLALGVARKLAPRAPAIVRTSASAAAVPKVRSPGNQGAKGRVASGAAGADRECPAGRRLLGASRGLPRCPDGQARRPAASRAEVPGAGIGHCPSGPRLRERTEARAPAAQDGRDRYEVVVTGGSAQRGRGEADREGPHEPRGRGGRRDHPGSASGGGRGPLEGSLGATGWPSACGAWTPRPRGASRPERSGERGAPSRAGRRLHRSRGGGGGAEGPGVSGLPSGPHPGKRVSGSQSVTGGEGSP